MRVIRTTFFDKQVKDLRKKYKLLDEDLNDFFDNLNFYSYIELWDRVYKYGLKNSSVPTWKRWWFRIIIKIFWDKCLPLIIYSKSIKENVSDVDIIHAMEEVLKDL